MTYVGTTAESSVRNPPRRIDSGLLSQRNRGESTSINEGGALWTYTSSNLTTSLITTGFFSDGALLGMRNGDIVIANTQSTQSSTGSILFLGVVTGVSSTSDVASLSTEGYITSTATAAGGG